MNEQLRNRLESLLWRTGGMIVVLGLGFVIENASELQIPSYLVVFAGLVVGEITKWLNSSK